MSGADLADPEIPRIFRRRLVVFLEASAAAFGGGANDLARTLDWLRAEQQPYWKRRIRETEDAYQQARRAWLDAESEVRSAGQNRGPHKESSFEERLVMDRARRRRDEAEEKLAMVQKCLIRLERDGAPLVHQCRAADFALHDLGAKAVARLDQLAEAVDRYLERTGRAPAAAPPASAPTEAPWQP